MIITELDEKITELEKQVKELNNQMEEICKYNLPTEMPKQYYVLLRKRQSIEAELWPLRNERSRLRREVQNDSSTTQDQLFINSYGEATKREITSATYQRSQKRIEKAVLRNMGM